MQHLAPSPWIAAGIALVGAGTIAATPVVTPLPALSVVHTSAVALTADFDPFGAWQDVFDTAKTNATTLSDFFSAAPFVAQQQEIANLIGYAQGLADGSTTFSDVIKDIQDNATNTFNAATFLAGDPGDLNVVSNYTMDLNHGLVYLALTGQAADLGFPAPDEPIPSIVNFLSSPLSGVLIGALSPSISPLVALSNSITDISNALNGSTPDVTTALQALADIPANMAGAFLNGSTLDLSSLIPLINEANLIPLPEGTSLDSLSIAFGGLLSPGETTSTIAGELNGIGGSILNSLGLDLSGVPLFGELSLAAEGIGPIGAWESLQEIIANSLGWDGTGNPLADLFGSL